MKKCTCGKVNDDAMKFCEECGAPLKDVTIGGGSSSFGDKVGGFVSGVKDGSFSSSVREKFTVGKDELDAYAENRKTIVPHKLALCEGEVPIRQYFCATESFPILGLNLYHLIQVTNKRVVYCRMGNSILGQKVDQEEVPLSDVSSVSMKRGFKVKFLSLLIAFSCLLIGFITLFMKPLNGIILLVIGAIAAFSMSNKYFKIRIGSKSGSNYPICSGDDDTFGKIGAAVGAGGDFLDKFLSVVPTKNIDQVECELNAMILDIQQLGDYGIEKWKEK